MCVIALPCITEEIMNAIQQSRPLCHKVTFIKLCLCYEARLACSRLEDMH